MDKIKKAMILAAGFGTRLKPLTDNTPKALLVYRGKTMLQHVIEKLEKEGIEEIVINTHHLSEQISRFLEESSFKVKIHISCEKEILGTGGGIKNAGEFLKDSGSFLVHNVDVFSSINIGRLYQHHIKHKPLATLAIQKRDTTRPLNFDSNNNLLNTPINPTRQHHNFQTSNHSSFYSAGFCGVHIISSCIFDLFREEGNFGIFETYFRLVNEGKRILGYDIGNIKWIDIGTFKNYSRYG